MKIPLQKQLDYIKIIAFIILILASLLMLFGKFPWEIKLFKMSIAFSVLLIVPGYLILEMTRKHFAISFIEKLPFSFCLSVGIIAIPGTIAYLLSFTLDALTYIILAIVLSLLILYIIFISKNKMFPFQDSFQIIDKNTLTYSIPLILLALLYAFILYRVGGNLIDDPDNLGVMNKLIFRQRITIGDFIYKGEGPDIRYAYSVYHLLIPLLSRLSGLEGLYLWYRGPSFFTPFAIIAWYSFGRTLFKKNFIGLLTSTILIFHFGGIMYHYIAFKALTLANGVVFYIMMPILWLVSFIYLETGKKTTLAFCAFLGFAIAAYHIHYFFLYLLSMSAFLFFFYFFKRKESEYQKRLIWLIFLTLVFSFPYLFLRSLSYVLANPAWTDLNLVQNGYFKSIVVYLSNFHYVSFNYVFRQIYLLFSKDLLFSNSPLAASLLAPLLILYIKKHNWAIFLFSNVVVVPIILLNPFIVTALSQLICIADLSRASTLIPTFPILAFFLGESCLFFRERSKPTLVGVSILALLIFHPVLKNGLINIVDQVKTAPDYAQVSRLSPAIFFLNKNLPRASVILSDLKTSHREIQTHTKHCVAAISPDSASYNLSDAAERAENVKLVLDPASKIEEAIPILIKYDVDYILLNPKFSTPETINKFEKNTSIFEKIFSQKGYIIYKVNIPKKLLIGKIKTRRFH